MEAPGDRNLLERAASGDARAFEAFVRRWEGPLYRFLRRVTGSAALAEEARQVTFVRVYTRAGRYRGGSVPVLLFRTAYRAALNMRRDERRGEALPIEAAETVPDGAAGPEALLDEREERDALRRSLARLPSEDRALLWVRVAEGMSLAEAARVLRAPPSTLRYRLYRALRRLRREMGSPAGSGGRHGLP